MKLLLFSSQHEAVKIALTEKAATQKAARSKHWADCVQHATRALETGPNSAELRDLRVNCATQIGDLDNAYADLTWVHSSSNVPCADVPFAHSCSRLSALNPSDVSLSLRIAHLSYFLLGTPSNQVKQCLHYDPESKPCKKAHRLFRSLEKDTAKVRNFVEGSSWRQAIKILDGSEGLLERFEQALEEATTASSDGDAMLPPQFQPKEKGQMRLELYALACKAAVGANELRKDKGMKWCDEVWAMDPENIDALVGQGEKLLKEEKWDEAMRVFDKAFEQSGRSSQDVRVFPSSSSALEFS